MEGSQGSPTESLRLLLEGELECTICRGSLNKPHTTPCGHTFCKGCIEVYLETHSKCPTCKKYINRVLLTENQKLSNISALFQSSSSVGESKSSANQVELLLSSIVPSIKQGEIVSLVKLLNTWQDKLKSQYNVQGYALVRSFLQHFRAKKQNELRAVERTLASIDSDLSLMQEKLDNDPEHHERGRMLALPPGDAYPGDAGTSTGSETPTWFPRAEGTKVPNRVVKLFTKLESLYQTQSHPEPWAKKRRLGGGEAGGEAEAQAGEARGASLPGKSTNVREEYLERLAKTLSVVAKPRKLRLVSGIPRRDMFQTAPNIVSGIGFSARNDLFATGGVSKKVKVYDFDNAARMRDAVPCPLAELSWRSKLSDLDWNKHEQTHLVTSDYDGVISLWDVEKGESFLQYDEHGKRAWSVSFSRAEVDLLTSGSDDCTLKVYSTKQPRSVLNVECPANVCSVQCHPESLYYVAAGCADHNAYMYDMRMPDAPVTTLTGHGKAISKVSYTSPREMLTASTDNTLALWDMTSGKRLRQFRGHTNRKHFVALGVSEGWVACGSETNELFVYHTSIGTPILSYDFSGEEDARQGQFVCSACWKPGSDMLVSASSDGNLRILKLQEYDE